MERIWRSGAEWSRTLVAFYPPYPIRKGVERTDDSFVTRIERTPQDEFKIRLVTGDKRAQ